MMVLEGPSGLGQQHVIRGPEPVGAAPGDSWRQLNKKGPAEAGEPSAFLQCFKLLLESNHLCCDKLCGYVCVEGKVKFLRSFNVMTTS